MFSVLFWNSVNSMFLFQTVFILLLQKKAIRILTESQFDAHCWPLFTSEKILTVINLYIYHNSKTHKIASSVRKLKYNIAYKTNNTLKKHLSHKKTPTNKYTQTGIYKLTCNDCPCFYIGQTGRSFSTRFKEHTKALTQRYINSNYAEHLINNNHNYTNIETNMHILHIQRKSRTLNTTIRNIQTLHKSPTIYLKRPDTPQISHTLWHHSPKIIPHPHHTPPHFKTEYQSSGKCWRCETRPFAKKRKFLYKYF